MLSDEARLDLVDSLTWLASELDQEGEYEQLENELHEASRKWAQLERYIRDIPRNQREQSHALMDDFESAQLSYVILRALWDNRTKTFQDANNQIRFICNMLEIDVFGDLKNTESVEIDRPDLGL